MGTSTTRRGGLGDNDERSQSPTLSNEGSTTNGQNEPQGEVEGNEYLTENDERETPTLIHKYNAKHPVSERLDTDHKFVIFNTGEMDVYKAKTELRDMLTEDAYTAIVSLKSIRHKGTMPRLEMTVTAELGDALKRMIRRKTSERSAYMMRLLRSGGMTRNNRSSEVLNKWRVVAYKPYFDRPKVDAPQNKKQPAKPLGETLLSLNVNGYHKKATQVEEMIRTESPIIVAIQETLNAERHYPVVVKGYRTFAKPWQKGFRGQALLIDARLPVYELPHEDSKHLIHVKISSMPGLPGPLHVFGVYLPSGGNYRRERTRLMKKLGEKTEDIMKKDKTAAIIGLGDFNIEEEELKRKLKRSTKELQKFTAVGSAWTRFPTRKGSRPTGIDHFVGNGNASIGFRKMRVLRNYPISDHRPIMLKMRKNPLETDSEFKTAKTKINAGPCRIYGERLVCHNRWSILANDEEVEPENENLEDLVDKFTKTFDETTRSLGIKTTVGESKMRLPRKIKTALQKYKKYGKEVTNPKGMNNDLTIQKYRKAKARFNKLMKEHKRTEEKKNYTQVSDAFVAHDHKTVWGRIKAIIGGETGRDTLQPVRNKDGKLMTDPTEILEVHREHYRTIMQHDPDNHAMDEEYWQSKRMYCERAEDLQGINEDLTWPEALESIRRMKRNTAPGGDGIHVNVLKQLVREECMGEIQRRNPEFRRPEYTLVDLPAEKLPIEPTTPMGKALYRILRAVWTQEKIPTQWQEVHLVSLMKPSGISAELGVDPESTDSYRGLTLISSAEKILLGVVTERLAKVYPLAKEQGGFRKKEEAIAQFLALTEIVRRRHLEGKDTFGIFIDFKKAYDRVQHGALFRILEHTGVRGKTLNFIKRLYRDNRIRVRVGGKLSEQFEMKRGNRQGCPLSPLLYIIFINGILKECTAGGVKVPGTKREDPTRMGALPGYNTTTDVCPGLAYADDILSFEETNEKAQKFLENLEKWTQEWDAEIGIKKCGVMCWSGNEETHQTHQQTTYKAGNNEIPKVDQYKYLGIWVDKRLIESRGKEGERAGTLEREFAKRQAANGNKALYALRPFLEDRQVPITLKTHAVRNLIMSKMLYGAEWLGYLNYNAEPLEKVLQKAIKWIIGQKGNDEKEVDSFTLCYELGLPTVEEELHARRTRILAKLQREDGGFKTWLGQLYKEPPPATWRKKTWITGSWNWLSHAKKSLPKHSDVYTNEYQDFCRNHEIEPRDVPKAIENGWNGEARFATEIYPLREWATLEQTFALTVRSNPYESPIQKALVEQRTEVNNAGIEIEWTPPEDETLQSVIYTKRHLGKEGREEYLSLVRIPQGRSSEEVTQLRTIRDVVLERQMTRNKSNGFLNYETHQFGVTRGYLRNAVSRPDLSEGTRWLMLVRIGAFPSVKTMVERLEKKGIKHTFDKEKCPLCKRVPKGTIWTHLMLRCSDEWVSSQREQLLNTPIRLIREGTNWNGQWLEISPDGTYVVDEKRQEMLIGSALVGGWDHIREETIPTYSIGFGQLDHVPDGMDTYSYTLVAEFLQKVAPLYMKTYGSTAYTAGNKDLELDVDQPLEQVQVIEVDDYEVEDPEIEKRMGGVMRIPEERGNRTFQIYN